MEEEETQVEAEAPATPEAPPELSTTEGVAPACEPVEASPDGALAVADDLEVLAAKRDEYLDLAQRTKADFENYRRRMIREVGAAESRGSAKLAKELLPALDTLQLALDAEEGDGPFAEGVRLVQRELVAALARAGIESYVPEGEPFDPQVHEAVAQQKIEGAEAGTVVEVMQRGYRHGDAVLRPARVLVAG